jgi:hypothetical protein
MQNLKIMETTRKKKANASNNWNGRRFKRLMMTTAALSGSLFSQVLPHDCQISALRDVYDDFNCRRRFFPPGGTPWLHDRPEAPRKNRRTRKAGTK